MNTRRDFLKKVSLLAAGGGAVGVLPESIERALAIDPAPGSTHLDAEHVVILMQENRSFDHAFGTLRGVRGFNDPRAVTLPNGNPVWAQTNAAGESYVPFRLDLRGTRATWMGSLPHTWPDQTDARNHGHHDGWLDAKRSSKPEYASLPLTLGHYTRDDLPFYHALADAFTVCDQAFASSLTATTPNRLHLWTGTVREVPSAASRANIRNEHVDYPSEARWTTFPERLESHGVPWCVYQNELSLPTGLEGEAKKWLGSFEDNPLEWFSQYHVRFAPSHLRHLRAEAAALAAAVAALPAGTAPGPQHARLQAVRDELAAHGPDEFARLPESSRSIHRRAFTTNAGDPHFHELEELAYQDGGVERRMAVPKGDVLFQFRGDVASGRLPAVSWLVAPENFSDHPDAPWYGAWYVSEVLDILTANPEVWRKTILILCYDENDGYFDHVPPFVPPAPGPGAHGKVSAGIDVAVEHVDAAQEAGRPKGDGRAGPIGLGYRVPLLVASPWSRGGRVCSQVFDHTSILRFLENWVGHRTGRPLAEPNISRWRRTVCGDLESVFRSHDPSRAGLPEPVRRAPFLGGINQAQFRAVPSGFHRLTPAELAAARKPGSPRPAWWPRQEPGTRPSCALPYELAVHGRLDRGRRAFTVEFEARNRMFGRKAAGAPFLVRSPRRGRDGKPFPVHAYAVAAGERVADALALDAFADGAYEFHVQGPNGFFRSFRGTPADPDLDIRLAAQDAAGGDADVVVVELLNRDARKPVTVLLADRSYGHPPKTLTLPHGEGVPVRVPWPAPGGWHDVAVTADGAPEFEQRFAGRVESGRDSTSDPAMA